MQSVYSQVCLIDGNKMFAVGSSELVQDELLSLFCCEDGHQMWLANYDKQKRKVEHKKEADFIPAISNKTISLLAQTTEKINIDKKVKPIKIIKKETVLKRASNNNKRSNSINIQKFGVETLLHKKMESDRLFAEDLEDEKSELLHVMLAQKKLFDRKKKKTFSLSSVSFFDKPATVIIYSLAILAIYTII